MPYIRTDSVEADQCTLFLGEQVVITDITKAQAEAMLAVYERGRESRNRPADQTLLPQRRVPAASLITFVRREPSGVAARPRRAM